MARALRSGEALTEYYRVDDMHSYDQLLRACGHFTHRYGKIDRLDSHTEYWMETEARLRTDFNILGPKIADLAADQAQIADEADVHRGRRVPAARGVLDPHPGSSPPLRAGDRLSAGRQARHRRGRGQHLQDRQRCRPGALFATKPPVEYLLEEFIQGTICTFDGLADKDGNPVFYTSMQYSQGVMETVNEDRHIYFYNLREIPADLEEAGRRLLKAFDVRERFFHFEFFRTTRWPARRAGGQHAAARRADRRHVQLRPRY